MKILFTSIGRRVELVQAFRAAAEKDLLNLIIYGGDMEDFAPALSFCDHAVKLPGIIEDSYIPTLVRICNGNRCPDSNYRYRFAYPGRK